MIAIKRILFSCFLLFGWTAFTQSSDTLKNFNRLQILRDSIKNS